MASFRGVRAVRGVLALVLSSGLLAVVPASAAPPAKGTATVATPPADVETAEQYYAKLDYEQANTVAERVTKKSGLTHDQLVRAHRVLAITYAILDKEEHARDAFFQLLTFEPDYQVDTSLGPKVTTPFMEARGSFRSLLSKPGVEVAPTISTNGGTLRIIARNPTRIARKVNVGYRWTSAGEYIVTQVPAGDTTTVEVAAAPPGRTRLDFYAQALDDRDNAVFEAGSPQVPKSAFAEAGATNGGGTSESKKSEGGSVFSSPIFWIVGGAAVAGASTALFFALRPHDPPTSATLSATMYCGNAPCN